MSNESTSSPTSDLPRAFQPSSFASRKAEAQAAGRTTRTRRIVKTGRAQRVLVDKYRRTVTDQFGNPQMQEADVLEDLLDPHWIAYRFDDGQVLEESKARTYDEPKTVKLGTVSKSARFVSRFPAAPPEKAVPIDDL